MTKGKEVSDNDMLLHPFFKIANSNWKIYSNANNNCNFAKIFELYQLY